MKAEPDAFSIDDLKRVKVEPWDGVRNYQARNNMKAMRVGDKVLFYASNAKPSGVVGLARVCKAAYPDHTARDKKSKYYDAKATAEKPIWEMVDVQYVDTFRRCLSLDELRGEKALAEMPLFTSARLSVQPCSEAEYNHVLAMARKAAK